MSDSTDAGQSAWRGVVVLIAVFIAGAAGGVAADRYYLTHAGVRPIAAGESAGWARIDPRVARRTEHSTEEMTTMNKYERRAVETGIPVPMLRLDLTPQQEAMLSEIAHRRRPAAESLMASLRPAVRNIENEMMQEMLCTLTPAQQAHWLAYMDSSGFEPDIVAERYRPVRTGTCASTRR